MRRRATEGRTRSYAGQKDAVRVRACAWRGKNAFLKGGADDDGATLN